MRAALTALEETLARKGGAADKPLTGRVVLIIGANASARAVAFGVRKRGGMPILAARDKELAQSLAGQFKCRFVPFEAIYSTTYDVLVVTSGESQGNTGEAAGLHPGILRNGSVVLDVTHSPRLSPLASEARARGCLVLSPRQVLQAVAASAVQLLTGQPADQAALAAALARACGAEEDQA